jgi:tRNA (guanine26-N2/guanine27-N2)-dimethyltransferase
MAVYRFILMSVSIKTRTIVEGKTSLVVPAEEEPKKFPTFFNPRGRFVRDVSVTAYKAFAASGKGELVFADSLCGAGARGIRVAKEIPDYSVVALNDISPTSVELARRTAQLNDVTERCKFSTKEVCSFLSTREVVQGARFDAVDVDPFGTPSPFVDCALRSIKDGGLLSVSATDSGVLCGVYPKVALRKYLGLPLRTEYSHEVGMRLLFGLISMTAMRFELSIVPLFCHHDMHYFRTYSMVLVGNKNSRQNEKSIGYILHCFKCGYRRTVEREAYFPRAQERAEDINENCQACNGQRLHAGGPLWVGPIQSVDFVERCRKIDPITLFEQELDTATYYDLSVISDKMGVRTPRIADVISKLRSAGRSASRTRLNPRAVRTDAELREVQEALKELGR